MPRLLDLFSCEGGASAGYVAAGFDVVGVDIEHQPHYPYEFVQGDAVEFVKEHGHEFDAIHASPPCQAYTNAWKIRKNDHPDLIGPTRDALIATGKPYVIENVVGAPLIAPVVLCGAMFGLHTYRHRLFETSFTLEAPAHPDHTEPVVKMGRKLREGDWYHAVGNFSNVAYVRADMGVPWMTRDGIRESIPPAYAEFVGRALLDQAQTDKAA